MSRNLRISTVRLICLSGFYLFLLVLYATAAPAQTMTPPQGAASAQMEELAARLELSGQQREALRPILLDHVESMRAVMEKYGIDPASGERPSLTVMFAVRRDMKSNRDAFDARVAEVLSPAQMDSFKKIRDEQRKAMRAGLRQAN